MQSFKSKHYKWLAFLLGALSILGTAVNRGSSNVIIPQIAEYFSADLPTVQWVPILYLVVVPVVILPIGSIPSFISDMNKTCLSLTVLVAFGMIRPSHKEKNKLKISQITT